METPDLKSSECGARTRLTPKEHSELLSALQDPAGSIADILPDILSSVNLKYVKLGYHYLITHATLVIPFLIITLAESWFISWGDLLQLWENLHFNLVSMISRLYRPKYATTCHTLNFAAILVAVSTSKFEVATDR